MAAGAKTIAGHELRGGARATCRYRRHRMQVEQHRNAPSCVQFFKHAGQRLMVRQMDAHNPGGEFVALVVAVPQLAGSGHPPRNQPEAAARAAARLALSDVRAIV